MSSHPNSGLLALLSSGGPECADALELAEEASGVGSDSDSDSERHPGPTLGAGLNPEPSLRRRDRPYPPSRASPTRQRDPLADRPQQPGGRQEEPRGRAGGETSKGGRGCDMPRTMSMHARRERGGSEGASRRDSGRAHAHAGRGSARTGRDGGFHDARPSAGGGAAAEAGAGQQRLAERAYRRRRQRDGGLGGGRTAHKGAPRGCQP